MDHATLAKELFLKGYNCSQAVLLAFSDVTGLEENTALRLSSSFGGGMGRLREVCGAVSGAFMVVGLVDGPSDPADRQAKATHYAQIQALAAQFRQANGSIVCRELLGLPAGPDAPMPEARTEQYYVRRPCAEYVAEAAQILDRYLENRVQEKENMKNI